MAHMGLLHDDREDHTPGAPTMTIDHNKVPRNLNGAALRTLHELQRKLRRQINEL